MDRETVGQNCRFNPGCRRLVFSLGLALLRDLGAIWGQAPFRPMFPGLIWGPQRPWGQRPFVRFTKTAISGQSKAIYRALPPPRFYGQLGLLLANNDIISRMTSEALDKARADIEATGDLLERAMKLSGLLTTLFQERGFPLVVVGGSAVEFYTEGGYMSGDIDFCRKTLRAVPPRLMQEIAESLGGKGLGRNWLICGLYVDLLGLLESETMLPERVVKTPYGDIRFLPPELALVERILFAEQDAECIASARQMMAAALSDSHFNWPEAERLANLPDFKVLPDLVRLKKEMSDAQA